jgi:hypothetical protein
MKHFKNYFIAMDFKAGALNDSAEVNFRGKMMMFRLPGKAWDGAMSPEKQVSLMARPIA